MEVLVWLSTQRVASHPQATLEGDLRAVTTGAKDNKEEGAKAEIPSPLILDLGRKSRGKIKRLRKGEGKLMDDVRTAIAHLQSAGNVAAGSQPVIVLVREKADKKALKLF